MSGMVKNTGINITRNWKKSNGRQRRVKIFTTEHSADNNVSEKRRGLGGNKENRD